MAARSEVGAVVVELMPGGDLASYLQMHKSQLSGAAEQLLGACVQLADAMAYLEHKHIIHRDLAARNVLVGADALRCVKLSDVGLSRVLTTSDYYRKTSSSPVPLKWMAPESIFERLYTSASDVWSFGVLCWEVFALGRAPYAKMSVEELLTAVPAGFRMPAPDRCPPDMCDDVTYFDL